MIQHIFAAAALLFAFSAQGQQLTAPQMATLKAVCLADQTCAALATAQSPDDTALAAWFNTADPGGFIVWRPDVPIGEANAVMVWTEIDTLSVGKARIWEWLRLVTPLDYRQSSIRQGINDAFAGLSTRVAVTNVGKRTATRAEKALATGTGTSVAPGIMAWYGLIDAAVASLIRS